MNEFTEFLKSGRHNAYIEVGDCTTYVRRSLRRLNSPFMEPYLDVASVNRALSSNQRGYLP